MSQTRGQVTRDTITWTVKRHARAVFDSFRKTLGADEYEAEKCALQDFLCAYFSVGDCSTKQGRSIAPIDGAPRGGKGLKVRWGSPGGGKSGGMRLAVVAFCEARRVVVCAAFVRKDEPDDAELQAAMREA